MNWKKFKSIKIVHIDSLRIWSPCPFHDDNKRPNLSITIKGTYKGRYKCWACGAEGRLKNDQLRQLKVSVTSEIGEESLPINWKGFVRACEINLKQHPLLKIQLAKQMNVSLETLDLWPIGFDGEYYTLPMVRYDSPIGKRHNNYYSGVQKRGFSGEKKCVRSSTLGYFLPKTACYPAITDDEISYMESIYICEGWSDALSVSDLGLFSIARPNCDFIGGLYRTVHIICDLFDTWGNIIIIADNNKVGKNGAYSAKIVVQDIVATKVFSFDKAKDIRELIKLQGKEQIKKELLSI